MKSVAVLGAGNGGCAIAVDLCRRGIDVRLSSRSEGRLAPLQECGGIEYTGALGEGFVPIHMISTNVGDVIEGVDLIVISTPTNAHAWYAEALKPYLRDGQTIMLNPGHTGGGLAFVHSLRRTGFDKAIRTGETITLTHGSRMIGPAMVRIFLVMSNVMLAAFPGKYIDSLLPQIREIFPSVIKATNVLETALLNLNAIEHPPGMLLNAGWIESTGGNFRFYSEGITPAVGRVIQALDDERLAVIREFKLKTSMYLAEMSFVEYFFQIGLTSQAARASGDVYQALQESEPNRPVKAPDSLKHRYMDEDVGFGLVPMYCLGQLVGVDMPATRAVIELSSLMRGVDYWNQGRTLSNMGLDAVPLNNLNSFLENGNVPNAHD
jgi:opine dehydrogenase